MSLLFAQVTPVDQAAAEAVWRLETTWRFAPWITVVAVAAIVLLIGYCYSRERSPAGRGYRLLLGGLRLTTFVLLVVMLSELLLAGSRSGRPRFVVLVDNSPSMSVADPSPDGDQVTRLEAAKQTLTDSSDDLLGRLADDYQVEVYAVASDRQPLAPAEGEAWADAASAIDVAADDSQTRLGDAIEATASAAGGPAPQGVLVVSDGRVTAGAALEAAAETARRVSTPLYFFGVGAKNEPPDIAIDDLLSEAVVFVDDLVSFRATLRTTAAVGGSVRVTLRREGDSKPIAEQTLQAPTGGGAQPVQLLHRPTQPGAFRYTLTAEGDEPERNNRNNALAHRLVVRDQQVRVLIASEGPSYEYRYLKHLLERDSTVKLGNFLQEADLEYASADPTAIERLPLRASELDEYDVAVLMDLDPRAAPRSFWRNLKAFVGESGGGLVLVAGPRNLPGRYGDLADFAAFYPADLGSAGVGETVTSAGFRLRPTPLGLRQAPLQLADSPAASAAVWRGLPELYWHAELGKLKPAAQTLATHPTASAAGGGAAPLVVSSYYGAGQVLVHGVDSTYRWRRQTGDAYFARYWVQTLRSLARGRLESAGAGLELAADREVYKPGEAVRLRLRIGAGQSPPAEGGDGVSVLIQPEAGPQQRVSLAPSPDARGVYEATLDRLPVGAYRAIIAGSGETAAQWEVAAPPGEMAQLSIAEDEMRTAAERSGGFYLPLDEAGELLAKLPPPRRPPVDSLPPIELWNRWWMIAGICGCLTAEWILRKRRGML
ncbi:MAG: vWA domain-containing protein [Planctomycetota bacterium]